MTHTSCDIADLVRFYGGDILSSGGMETEKLFFQHGKAVALLQGPEKPQITLHRLLRKAAL